MSANAGWHPDPHDPTIVRYWNGSEWTHHTSPNTLHGSTTPPAAHSITASVRATPEPGTASERMKSSTKWIIGVLAACALFVAFLVGTSAGEKAGDGTFLKPEPLAQISGDGVKMVGAEIKPGQYRTTNPTGFFGCTWFRLAAPERTQDSIIGAGAGLSEANVTILPTDIAFDTRGCGTWTEIR